MSETFIAAFSGCLLALLTGTAILVTVYLPLARKRARIQLQGALEILATRGIRSSARPDPRSSATAVADVGPIRASAVDDQIGETADATEDAWSDDWDDTEPATQGSGAPIELGTAWAVGIVPAGARSRIRLARTVFLGSDEEGVRVGVPRRGTFRGSEIQIDRDCAESFAICDVLVRGVSQLWSEEVKDGRRCVSRVGEIPAEAFTAEPFGALTMDAAGPDDDVEIVVRNVDESDREFRAMIRGEYRSGPSR